MTDYIDETLKLWRSTPFKWGVRDCMLRVADYLETRTGVDHGAPFRGRYDSEAGARAIIKAYGGEKSLLDRTALSHTSRPARGDVILMQIGDNAIAALCTGQGVAASMERGVVEIEIRFIKILCAWKVP